MKSTIIQEIGQSEVLLPSLIGEGLAANDRVKTRLSVLQTALQHARHPTGAGFDLVEECRRVGIDPLAMESLIKRGHPVGDTRIAAPGLADLLTAIWDDMASMIRAVEAGDAAAGEGARERLAKIRERAATDGSDNIEISKIALLTKVSDRDDDSLHRLIMDLHKGLNRLSALHAEEVLAGAHVYGLLPEDRSAVEAFMRGVDSTRQLKFGHPGLATTATRVGAQLTIQNDIGETDAHVVVINVEQNVVVITYTDVHLPRAKFFTNLSNSFPVEWSGLERKTAAELGDEGVFYLVTGRYPADQREQRDAFLESLGASLVFLIDWNKARKVLRAWVPKGDSVAILDWAARHRVGHRGLLVLGGGEFIASAVRHAASNRIGFGERLDRALGRQASVDFLKSALRISAEALLRGDSVRLARDRIEADLVRHLQRVKHTLLTIVIRQTGLARDIVAEIIQFVSERRAGRPFDCAALTRRARQIEGKADRIAIEARAEIARLAADRGIERLVNVIEDAIDELEQAAFMASLVPADLDKALLDPLAELCEAALRGTKAATIGIVSAMEVPEGNRIDAEDALAAVGRLIEVEHEADAAERAVTATILTGEIDLKSALSVLEMARALERSTDRLAAFGHVLHAHVLADLSG